MLNGNDAMENDGGAPKTVTCPDGSMTKGGKGGDLSFPGDDGTPMTLGGKGGMLSGSCGMAMGGDGQPAVAPTAGARAALLGSLTSTGWIPADGKDRTPGGPGGGGGAGILGGAGGGGGHGGGASIALACVSSKVALTASSLTAHDAGLGGTGAGSQSGQAQGGIGGNRTGGACLGGNGGAGAKGGAGGGGAGGISIGVLYKDQMPTRDGISMGSTMVGMKGGKGVGGAAGMNDGIDGVAQSLLMAP